MTRLSSLTRSSLGRAAFGFVGTASVLISNALVAAEAQAASPVVAERAEGVLKVDSAHGFDDTVARIKADVATKGIRFFDAIDQSALGADAKLPIRRSTLILFGNPPLGVQFLQSNPYAGLDWPVRMLVIENENGSVSVAWTDFAFIARRYGIADRDAQLKMASDVAASIASAATE